MTNRERAEQLVRDGNAQSWTQTLEAVEAALDAAEARGRQQALRDAAASFEYHGIYIRDQIQKHLLHMAENASTEV